MNHKTRTIYIGKLRYAYKQTYELWKQEKNLQIENLQEWKQEENLQIENLHEFILWEGIILEIKEIESL